ncbi:MAG: hypothetical protein ABS949_19920 [Solibacillus sp.]
MLKKNLYKVLSSSLLVTIFGFASYNEASASTLSDTQKEELYEQYQEIVEEVRAEYNLAPEELELSPKSGFTDELWIDPQAFKERAIYLTQLEPTLVEILPTEESLLIAPMSTTSNAVTQTLTFKQGSDSTSPSVNVAFRATFLIDYNTTQQRMVFTNLKSFTATPTAGKWAMGTTKPTITEGGRTLTIVGSGKLDYVDLNLTKTFTLTYTCSSSGTVSSGS